MARRAPLPAAAAAIAAAKAARIDVRGQVRLARRAERMLGSMLPHRLQGIARRRLGVPIVDEHGGHRRRGGAQGEIGGDVLTTGVDLEEHAGRAALPAVSLGPRRCNLH
jgi:hypothetical protein